MRKWLEVVVDCNVSPWTSSTRSRTPSCNVTCARSQFRGWVEDRIKPRRRCASVRDQFCKNDGKGRRYLDLVPVVFSAEDGGGCTRDLCSASWTEHKGRVGSTRTFKQQALRRHRKGLRRKPLGRRADRTPDVSEVRRSNQRMEGVVETKERCNLGGRLGSRL